MADELSLSAEFPRADERLWRELATKALDGAAPETLNSRTQHGVAVRALYTEADWPSALNPSGAPGAAPFTRGSVSERDPYLPWDIRQEVTSPRPLDASRELLEALEGGASSIELLLDRTGQSGVQIWSASDFATVLEGVRLDLASLSLAPVGGSLFEGLPLAALLASSGVSADARIDFNLDPIGVMAKTGRLQSGPSDLVASFAAAAIDMTSAFPRSTALRVDARIVHEAGGTEVQELAYMAATGAEYVRSQMMAGASARAACRNLVFSLSVGPDLQVELAKLRAARRIWAQIADAFGASAAEMRILGCSSRRMLSRRDSWVNVLRTTASCFAAGVGGADIVLLSAFTDPLGRPGPAARRLCRNTQIIAQEESGLGKVMDPAGGAWALERLTEDLAAAAWGLFQQVERDGGILKTLSAGRFQAAVAQARTEREQALARRKEWVTGVNDFPDLTERTPPVADPPVRDDRLVARHPSVGGSFSALCAAALEGANLAELSFDGEPAPLVAPLAPFRLSEPFEALRDRSEAAAASGAAPEVLLAVLGPLSEHSARATYAQNFFGVAGVATPSPSPEHLLELVRRQVSAGRAPIVCLCGSDKRYAAEAQPAASALRDAGAARIILAGRPGDSEAALRSAGVTDFIYVGVDVPATLTDIMGWPQA
ncbi:MAG: methylmalonyl-CoA mutase [Alphaproteobacteria bacterium]|nr:methylmalonyl-CoA mutase [Alphaproteobacteria bacterium]